MRNGLDTLLYIHYYRRIRIFNLFSMCSLKLLNSFKFNIKLMINIHLTYKL